MTALFRQRIPELFADSRYRPSRLPPITVMMTRTCSYSQKCPVALGAHGRHAGEQPPTCARGQFDIIGHRAHHVVLSERWLGQI